MTVHTVHFVCLAILITLIKLEAYRVLKALSSRTLCYLDSGAGTNLGVGHVKSKNRGYADMDPNLDTGAGIRYLFKLLI